MEKTKVKIINRSYPRLYGKVGYIDGYVATSGFESRIWVMVVVGQNIVTFEKNDLEVLI